MKNAFSIDLEDWYHPELLRKEIGPGPKISQAGPATDFILDLLDKHKVKATFFVLGETAEQNKDLVRRIYSNGHEIASHGMSHRPLWEIGRDGFSQELDEYKSLMKGILGKDILIKGYRAPSFSLDNSTNWALEVLKEKGYMYDSSIFPIRNRLYGLNGAPFEVYRPLVSDLRKADPSFEIIEFPLAVYKFLGIKIPVAGGFYFRVMPLILFKNLLKMINRNRPFVFFLHPWESYSRTPRIKGISATHYFITYWGISGVLKKIDNLLGSFSFAPLCEILKV